MNSFVRPLKENVPLLSKSMPINPRKEARRNLSEGAVETEIAPWYQPGSPVCKRSAKSYSRLLAVGAPTERSIFALVADKPQFAMSDSSMQQCVAPVSTRNQALTLGTTCGALAHNTCC